MRPEVTRQRRTRAPRWLPISAALLLAPLWAGPAAGGEELSAREIMQRVQDRDDGDNATLDMEMLLIDKAGKTRRRQLRSLSKDRGKDTYQLMFFLSPPDVKDTGFLTYDYDSDEKDDDQWLYLPALRKTKRIAGGDKSGSFMGSDFNYSDMTERDLDSYDYTLMKEGEVDGAKVWQIESVPRTRKEIEETGYKRSILMIRQDSFVLVRAVRWLEKGSKLRYFDVKKLEKIDGIWVATEIHMTTKKNRKTLHKTILRNHNVKFGQPLEFENFTLRALEKGA